MEALGEGESKYTPVPPRLAFPSASAAMAHSSQLADPSMKGPVLPSCISMTIGPDGQRLSPKEKASRVTAAPDARTIVAAINVTVLC